MGIAITAEATALYEQAISIVMAENACDADVARSSLASSATRNLLPLDEVASEVVAVAGRQSRAV